MPERLQPGRREGVRGEIVLEVEEPYRLVLAQDWSTEHRPYASPTDGWVFREHAAASGVTEEHRLLAPVHELEDALRKLAAGADVLPNESDTSAASRTLGT